MRFRQQLKRWARELNVRGLMNVAIRGEGATTFNVLEVNPRGFAYCSVPAKRSAYMAKLAAKVMTGNVITRTRFTKEIGAEHFSVKEAVFHFCVTRVWIFRSAGNENRTGEVMGIDIDLGLAYAKSQMAAPPPYRKAEESSSASKTPDKEAIIPVAAVNFSNWFLKCFHQRNGRGATKQNQSDQGFQIHEDVRTARPDQERRHQFHINTPSGKIRENRSGYSHAALAAKIPIMTTVRAALASANGIRLTANEKSKCAVCKNIIVAAVSAIDRSDLRAVRDRAKEGMKLRSNVVVSRRSGLCCRRKKEEKTPMIHPTKWP